MKQLLMGLLFLNFYTQQLSADLVEFPDEELARESVLPVFDQPEAVKNRRVLLRNRIELSGTTGAFLNDPFFNIVPLSFGAHYHLSEMSSFGVLGSYYLSAQSSYVAQIKAKPAGGTIKFDTAPAAQFSVLGQYEFSPYYGKVSFSKQMISNLVLSVTGGAGMINTKDNTSVLLAFGLNQKLFITKHLGLKADLQAYFYKQKDVVANPEVEKNVVAFVIFGGLVYLLPGF